MTRYEAAKHIALLCGGIIKEKFGASFAAREKSPGDYVTEADLESERRAQEEIMRLFPGDGILSEEAGNSRSSGNLRIWIIDPLDGTNNFVRHIPFFCSSVAVCENGRPVAAAVYDPVHHELFHCQRGKGAFLWDAPLRVAAQSDPQKMVCYLGWVPGLRTKDEFFALTRRIRRSGCAFRRLGSAALAHAYIAAGRMDGAFSSGLHSWDLAAGCLLIEEAGGRVADLRGEAPDMDASQLQIIAGSPRAADFLARDLEVPR
ncbi:MAG: inositol monophosphatase [Abditibacteriota bacterium]|nr:inositol monophosphatase [Abditibacteriota bacterium]